MITIGLTGGIGMGKSTTAKMFQDHGIEVWDADGAVHRLYQAGRAGARAIKDRFGPVLNEEGAVDREKLADQLRRDPRGFDDLNRLIHPLVAADRERFLEDQRAAAADLALCDIPLLLENAAQAAFDVIVVVEAEAEVRRARVLARDGMTEEKYRLIVDQQMPAAEKRAFADFIVETDRGLDHARAQVAEIVAILKKRSLEPCESSER